MVSTCSSPEPVQSHVIQSHAETTTDEIQDFITETKRRSKRRTTHIILFHFIITMVMVPLVGTLASWLLARFLLITVGQGMWIGYCPFIRPWATQWERLLRRTIIFITPLPLPLVKRYDNPIPFHLQIKIWLPVLWTHSPPPAYPICTTTLCISR